MSCWKIADFFFYLSRLLTIWWWKIWVFRLQNMNIQRRRLTILSLKKGSEYNLARKISTPFFHFLSIFCIFFLHLMNKDSTIPIYIEGISYSLIQFTCNTVSRQHVNFDFIFFDPSMVQFLFLSIKTWATHGRKFKKLTSISHKSHSNCYHLRVCLQTTRVE